MKNYETTTISVNSRQSLLIVNTLIIAFIDEENREITYLDAYTADMFELPHHYKAYKSIERSYIRVNIEVN